MSSVYEAAGISRQAHYQYHQRAAAFEERLYALCVEADLLREEHPGCGVEKMYHILQPEWIGRDRFIDVMMGCGYRLKKMLNYSRTTYAGKIYYPNLIQGILLWDKNQLWQSDITYYRIRDAFYYLVFIIDVYTKRILGYSAEEHLRASANLKALKMAIKNAGTLKYHLIHHSDRGSQYGERTYVQCLNDHHIDISMCLKPQDNAYAERINGIIKNEYLKYWDIPNLTALKKACRKAVEHYNTKRTHCYLPAKKTPLNFEKSLVSLDMNDRHFETVYSNDNPITKRPEPGTFFVPENIPDGPVCPVFNLSQC
jgi:putative transposase